MYWVDIARNSPIVSTSCILQMKCRKTGKGCGSGHSADLTFTNLTQRFGREAGHILGHGDAETGRVRQIYGFCSYVSVAAVISARVSDGEGGGKVRGG